MQLRKQVISYWWFYVQSPERCYCAVRTPTRWRSTEIGRVRSDREVSQLSSFSGCRSPCSEPSAWLDRRHTWLPCRRKHALKKQQKRWLTIVVNEIEWAKALSRQYAIVSFNPWVTAILIKCQRLSEWSLKGTMSTMGPLTHAVIFQWKIQCLGCVNSYYSILEVSAGSIFFHPAQ